MTDKLTIVINGLEYVAKGSENNDLAQAESELSLIKEIAKLRNEIKSLEADLGLASYANEELQLRINDLEQQFDESCGLLADADEENENLRNEIKSLEKASFREAQLRLDKDIEIRDLQQANDNLTGEVQGMSMIINDLEDQVAELEEENGNIMCKYNELEEAMNDILCVARQFV